MSKSLLVKAKRYVLGYREKKTFTFTVDLDGVTSDNENTSYKIFISIGDVSILQDRNKNRCLIRDATGTWLYDRGSLEKIGEYLTPLGFIHGHLILLNRETMFLLSHKAREQSLFSDNPLKTLPHNRAFMLCGRGGKDRLYLEPTLGRDAEGGLFIDIMNGMLTFNKADAYHAVDNLAGWHY